MAPTSNKGLSNKGIVALVVAVLLAVLVLTYGSQFVFDSKRNVSSGDFEDQRTQYEIKKLDAEISHTISETAGSLLWLKLIALFVTVGGAVGGYLIGQSRTTLARISFEDRKNVDEVYQCIVQDLAADSAILRAAAAVKLGSILKSFPVEWNVSDSRVEQILQLTKEVLAAALSIEQDQKVLKTLTVSIVLHKPDVDKPANVRALDFSGAKAEDAYWARCDFQNSDFYTADLTRASFRKSNLSNAQFREALLIDAVLNESDCTGTNFKMADLRGASFTGATLKSVNFENAKVFSMSVKGAEMSDIATCFVDASPNGDGSLVVTFHEWLASA